VADIFIGIMARPFIRLQPSLPEIRFSKQIGPFHSNLKKESPLSAPIRYKTRPYATNVIQISNRFGFTVKLNPVLGSAIPVSGVKPKRRWLTYSGYFSR